jgi:hypothetical protein
MKKYSVCQVTHILGEAYNKDLKIISASSPEEAIVEYKRTRPFIDRYSITLKIKEVNYGV